MRLVLQTVINGKGRKVFLKQRTGKSYAYVAKDEVGKTWLINKDFILKHRDSIVNVGISNDKIYPVDNKDYQKSAGLVVIRRPHVRVRAKRF